MNRPIRQDSMKRGPFARQLYPMLRGRQIMPPLDLRVVLPPGFEAALDYQAAGYPSASPTPQIIEEMVALAFSRPGRAPTAEGTLHRPDYSVPDRQAPSPTREAQVSGVPAVD
jgi:hypothetical protein